MHIITIEIRTTGAAFEDDEVGEVAEILHRLASDLVERAGDDVTSFDGHKLLDVNGNTCGEFSTSREGKPLTQLSIGGLW